MVPGEGLGPFVKTAFSPSQGPEIIQTCVSAGSEKSGTGAAPNKLAIPQPVSLAVYGPAVVGNAGTVGFAPPYTATAVSI